MVGCVSGITFASTKGTSGILDYWAAYMQVHKIHVPVYAFMAAAIGLVLDVLTGRSSAKGAPLRVL